MPSPLTVDDFKPSSITCELRYKNAYLIYDRTGQVIEDVRESFTDINVSGSSPQQTSWVTNEGTLTLELAAARVIANRVDRNADAFSKQCKAFFGAVTHRLQIGVFTRIGLRYVLRKEFKTLDESRSTLASLRLPNLKPTKRFNSSDSPVEVVFRWEDSQIGATVRLKAETVELKASPSPVDFGELIPKIVDRKIHYLLLDVDYYTVAPVNNEQWSAEEWIPQKLRIIRKEVDGILGDGQ